MKKNAKKHDSTFDLQKVQEEIQRHQEVTDLKLNPFIPTDANRQMVEKYEIRGGEVKALLQAYGSTQREFAKFINKSPDYVSLLCRATNKVIKYRFAQMLESFVGTDLYITIIARDRKRRRNSILEYLESKKKRIILDQEKKSG
ncbi:MAG: hypothetical protein IPM69_15415 [Ignavibacteria bacterium]|nr:hypothetical protein [Ignavibacteria bacterium]